jgi:hypothetical protein
MPVAPDHDQSRRDLLDTVDHHRSFGSLPSPGAAESATQVPFWQEASRSVMTPAVVTSPVVVMVTPPVMASPVVVMAPAVVSPPVVMSPAVANKLDHRIVCNGRGALHQWSGRDSARSPER